MGFFKKINAFLKSGHEAFTLLEILVVLTIIGILLAIILPNFSNIQDTAMKKAALAEMKGLVISIYNYKMNNGLIPGSVDDLVKSGDIKKDMAIDPWNRKYVLEYDPGTGVLKIISPGPDGQVGTKDDIVNEESM